MAFVAIRLIHILFGAMWFSIAVFAALWLMPAVSQAGPDGMKVMAALQRRGYVALFPVLAVTTVLSGIWLYWRATGGFDPDLSRTHAGMAYGTGGVLAIIAIVLGVAIIAPAGKRMMAAGETLAKTSDGPERARLLATLGELRKRVATAGAISAVLLAVAITLMAIAPFI